MSTTTAVVAPLTREEACSYAWHELHYTGNGPCTRTTGPRGGITESIVRVRRNGATQTWVTRPTEWRLPVKHGIRARGQFSIYHHDAANYHPASRCPLKNS